MTDTTATYLLIHDVEAVGLHSRACRKGTAEVDEVFSIGCAPCQRAAAAFYAAEARDPWVEAEERKLWDLIDRDRDAAFYGGGW